MKCLLASYRRTTRRPTSFPRSDFAKAGRRERLGTRSLRAKPSKLLLIIVCFLQCETNEVNMCTYPFSIRVILPSTEFGSGLFDDQHCTGKRSRLGASL